MRSARAPRSAAARWGGPLLALLAFGGYVLLALRGDFDGLLADSYVYLAAAREFARGTAADWSLLLFMGRYYAFPPLFPLVMAAFGAGGQDPIATYTLGAALMAGVVWAAWAWLRGLGLPVLAVALSSLLVAVMPGTLQTVLNVLSEPLYLLLTLLAARALSAASPRASAWWTASVCVGLAVLCRSVGVVALPALAIAWWAQRRPRPAPWTLLPALVLPLLWWGLGRWLGFAGYGAGMPPVAQLGATVTANLQALGAAGVTLFAPAAGQVATGVVAVAGMLALPVWLQRLRERRFDAWYLLFYSGVLLVWPHPAHAPRFLFVVIALVLGYAALALARMRRPALAAAVPAGLLAVALPGALAIVLSVLNPPAGLEAAVRTPAWYLAPPAQAAQTTAIWRRMLLVARAVEELPANACVASVLPEQVLFYGRRRVVDWARIQRTPAAVNLIADGCPYVLMFALTTKPAPPGIGPMYPFHVLADRLQPLRLERSRQLDRNSPLLAMLARVAPRP